MTSKEALTLKYQEYASRMGKYMREAGEHIEAWVQAMTCRDAMAEAVRALPGETFGGGDDRWLRQSAVLGILEHGANAELDLTEIELLDTIERIQMMLGEAHFCAGRMLAYRRLIDGKTIEITESEARLLDGNR